MSNINTSVNKQQNITTNIVSGEISANDILNRIEEFYHGYITKYILWDFSDASFKNISSDDITKIVALSNKYTQTRNGGKTAMVFSSKFGFGLGRMFDIQKDIADREVSHMSFQDKNDALNWLFSEAYD